MCGFNRRIEPYIISLPGPLERFIRNQISHIILSFEAQFLNRNGKKSIVGEKWIQIHRNEDNIRQVARPLSKEQYLIAVGFQQLQIACFLECRIFSADPIDFSNILFDVSLAIPVPDLCTDTFQNLNILQTQEDSSP